MLYFTGKNPLLVFTITLSNTMNIDGNTKMTTIILMIAPLAINIHTELIISIFEYNPTPIVAAKKLSALTMIDCADARCAVVIESYFSAP